MVGMALDSFAGREGNLTPSFELASGSSALTPASSYRRATPPPSSTLSLAAMPPTLRPLPPRSPPSSSSAFAVSRRSPVSPRPAVSSPSGMEETKSMDKYRTPGTDWNPSDGIARVHGMNNVQAEELVEYVAFAISAKMSSVSRLTFKTGSPPVSRACA